MLDPDQRKLLADIDGGRFQIGVAEEHWSYVPDSKLPWPNAMFWVAAAKRDGAPDRYFVRLHCRNYPIDPPTGTFWDPVTQADLERSKRPFGVGLVAVTFRVDWKDGSAFYHPYDRAASRDGHEEWKKKHPYWVWDEKHTVTDLLSVIYELLQSRDYHGLYGHE